MEAQGILTTDVVNVGNRIRKYYSVTSTGKKVANDKVSEFSDFIDTMIFLLDLKPKMG
jgi:DNA-binding PadR family transcriptional regulator